MAGAMTTTMTYAGNSGDRRQRARAARVVALSLLVTLLQPPAALAQDTDPTDVPWNRSTLHLKILLTALTYEHNLQQAEADELRIGVLFDSAAPATLALASEVIVALERQAGKMTFRRRMVVVTAVPASDNEHTGRALIEKLDVLYMVDGLPRRSVDRAIALTRVMDVITITGVEGHVRRGVVLGAVLRGKSPVMMVNYAGAVASGADFSTQLLQLADVVGHGEKD